MKNVRDENKSNEKTHTFSLLTATCNRRRQEKHTKHESLNAWESPRVFNSSMSTSVLVCFMFFFSCCCCVELFEWWLFLLSVFIAQVLGERLRQMREEKVVSNSSAVLLLLTAASLHRPRESEIVRESFGAVRGRGLLSTYFAQETASPPANVSICKRNKLEKTFAITDLVSKRWLLNLRASQPR